MSTFEKFVHLVNWSIPNYYLMHEVTNLSVKKTIEVPNGWVDLNTLWQVTKCTRGFQLPSQQISFKNLLLTTFLYDVIIQGG